MRSPRLRRRLCTRDSRCISESLCSYRALRAARRRAKESRMSGQFGAERVRGVTLVSFYTLNALGRMEHSFDGC